MLGAAVVLIVLGIIGLFIFPWGGIVVGLVIGFLIPPFGFVAAGVGVVLLILLLLGIGRGTAQTR